MATRTISHVAAAGLNAYIRVFNATGQAFDFADGVFKTLAAATTPYQAMTERTDVDGTSRSGYTTELDLGAIHPDVGLEEFLLHVYDNAAPADADVAISEALSLPIELGDGGRRQLLAWGKLSVKSSAGNDAQVAAWLEADGERVELHEINGVAFTATAATDIVNATAHGLSNGDALTLTTSDTLPDPLAVDTVYYVVSKTTDTFKLSATSGGAAIDITDTGTGLHKFHKPTATVTVREQGASAVLFAKAFTAADLADIGGALRGIFEGEQSAPAFTDDRQFEVTVAITVGLETVSTTHRITVIG